MTSLLEERFYALEKYILDRLLQLGKDSIVIASTSFQGGESKLIYNSNNIWSVNSIAGQYPVHNPLLDKLIEKYALITNIEFQQKVGISSLPNWECERMRLREMEKMLKENRASLLAQFVEEMESALYCLQIAG